MYGICPMDKSVSRLWGNAITRKRRRVVIFLTFGLCLVGRQDKVEHFELATEILRRSQLFYFAPLSHIFIIEHVVQADIPVTFKYTCLFLLHTSTSYSLKLKMVLFTIFFYRNTIYTAVRIKRNFTSIIKRVNRETSLFKSIIHHKYLKLPSERGVDKNLLVSF